MPEDPLTGYFRRRGIPQVDVTPGTHAPLRFGDPLVEQNAARNAVALFDFSFMSHFEVRGPDASAFLERLQTRVVAERSAGRILYTLMCREDGTVFNDATVWIHRDGRYWLFTGRRSDRAHIQAVAEPFNVAIDERFGEFAVIAVQGPESAQLLARIGITGMERLRYFRFAECPVGEALAWIGRIGYSGERGFELLVDSAGAVDLWERLLEAGAGLGAVECGFEAANALRIEAGYLLFARELQLRVTPATLGYGRLIENNTGRGFVGAAALRARRSAPASLLVGLRPRARGEEVAALPDLPLPESGLPGVAPGRACLTSACWSALLDAPLGMGYVAYGDHHPGTAVRLQNGQVARVARLPYYDPPRVVPRH